MDAYNYIADQLSLKISTVQKVVDLLEEGATIPFIARYRKEVTGGLDEVVLESVKSTYSTFQDLVKRKETILKAIDDQGLLTETIFQKIQNTWNPIVLEDLYLPYKKKVKTKATVARENGLEGLAKIIMSQRSDNIEVQARRFINKNVPDTESAISGATHIIAEWINENSKIRDILRNTVLRRANIVSAVAKGKEGEAVKYKDYFDYSGSLGRIPSHRLLAILRGEQEKFLKVKVEVDRKQAVERLERFYIRQYSSSATYITSAIKESLTRLLLPSLKKESLNEAKERADLEAIQVFARNAQQLLLASPLGEKRVLAIDPGFRTGCKVVCLDEQGSLLQNKTIYPHPPQNQKQDAEYSVDQLIRKYDIEAIAIGNGTAGKESYQWLSARYGSDDVSIFLVNEDGASIYSASEIAREEFPDKDITVRGAVSIGRRLIDPLAELVKIDPKSIGVGQYQHDVNQKQLKDSLTNVVVSCVNKVGVNVNTASKHLLSYVSGLGPGLAQNIVNYRKEIGGFADINELHQVQRLGNKAYEQCAGFLRIKDGNNPLDNTGVHPESYSVVKKILKDSNVTLEEAIGNESLLDAIDLQTYITAEVGLPTLQDIIKELKKPGLDPRSKAEAVTFTKGIESISDLKAGQVITGVVTNLTKFGAFLDVGIKESALLHISQIVDRYISDPAEVLSINDSLEVKILEVDTDRKRISVTLKNK